MTSFALYTTIIDNIQINKLKKYLYNKYSYSAFHVFFDGESDLNNDTASLPSFYMKFYKGCLIFNSLSEYLKEYQNVLSSEILILLDEELDNIPKKQHQNVSSIKLETEEIL